MIIVIHEYNNLIIIEEETRKNLFTLLSSRPSVKRFYFIIQVFISFDLLIS